MSSHGRLSRPGSAAATRSTLTRSASLTSSRPQWRGVQAQRKTEKSPTRIGADEFALGQRLAGAGEHEMAVKKFGAAIAALPADVRLYVARGESQCALGAHRRAVYDFSMAIRLEPEVAAHHRARGLAFVRLGQLTSLPGALRRVDPVEEHAQEAVAVRRHVPPRGARRRAAALRRAAERARAAAAVLRDRRAEADDGHRLACREPRKEAAHRALLVGRAVRDDAGAQKRWRDGGGEGARGACDAGWRHREENSVVSKNLCRALAQSLPKKSRLAMSAPRGHERGRSR